MTVYSLVPPTATHDPTGLRQTAVGVPIHPLARRGLFFSMKGGYTRSRPHAALDFFFNVSTPTL